jgi:VIT1/CCC1 family predicted Fe2+/Mn2+ transporter
VKRSEAGKQAVFGGADGVVLAVGFIASFASQPHALVKAAVAAGLAELVGMTTGSWLSDSGGGFWPALANGGAALAACVIPALPYLAASGAWALIPSVALVVAVAGVIAWLRPEKGILAAVQTFGVLLVAAGLCYAAGLI